MVSSLPRSRSPLRLRRNEIVNPTVGAERVQLRCCNPVCKRTMHEDPAFGGYCCKKCHWRQVSGSKSNKHGQLCVERYAHPDARVAAPEPPEVPAVWGSASASSSSAKAPPQQRQQQPAQTPARPPPTPRPPARTTHQQQQPAGTMPIKPTSAAHAWLATSPGHPRCSMEIDCIGSPITEVVRHVYLERLERRLGDLYCMACFASMRARYPDFVLDCVRL